MANKRLVAILTAMILAGNTLTGAHAATLEQLTTIEAYIQSEAWEELYAYLQANPSLLEGTSPINQELREFVDAVEEAMGSGSGVIESLSIPSSNVVSDAIASY